MIQFIFIYQINLAIFNIQNIQRASGFAGCTLKSYQQYLCKHIMENDEEPHQAQINTRQQEKSPIPNERSTIKVDQSPTKVAFNHRQFGLFADSSMEVSNQLGENIKLVIDGNETRGTAFMKYVVYHICGNDKNGPIDVYRRFNQFYKMRLSLLKRFPGCFIPSIPDKSISLVDDQIVNKRQRFLNDFIRKISKIPHLYLSEQFQALLRSAEKDLSGTFETWPNPTSSDIINKYKENFAHLSGRVIDTQIRAKIHEFSKVIQKTNIYSYKFKGEIKKLASARDKFDKSLVKIFTTSLPSFETQFISSCVKNEEDELICTNQMQAKFLEHEKIITDACKKNPYWLLYDVIKHQERDGIAFLECVKCIEEYQNKKYELQIKMSENTKTITQITLGKKSNSETKYKLEVENQNLKKQKENVQLLTDIIIALVAFVEMDRFKNEKAQLYVNFLKKLGGYEINQVQNMHQIWYDWKKKTQILLKAIPSLI